MKKMIVFSAILFTMMLSSMGYSGGKISGEIQYAGDKVGPVIVAAFSLKLDFENLYTLDTLAGPGTYEFAELDSGTYLIAAYMDVNGDGLPGFTEPLGAYSGTLKLEEGQELTEVDVYLNILPQGSAEISGSITYSGSLAGTIHVYALGFTGTPFNHTSLPAGNGAYTFSGLKGGEYVVAAFLDVDGDELPDLGEPVGFIKDLIIIADGEKSTGNDITFFEPSSFTGSIFGTVTYNWPAPGDTIYIYTVGLTNSPMSVTKLVTPQTAFTVPNLDAGDYYMFAFLDTNKNESYNLLKIKIIPGQLLPEVTLGEDYELIDKPIVLSEGESKQQNLILAAQGNASISGKVSYTGTQNGIITLVGAVGLSPSWIGMTAQFVVGNPPFTSSYTVGKLDAGYYAVFALVITDYTNPTFDLNMPIGFYTKGLVQLQSDDNVTGIDFILQDSTTATSAISGAITAPEGMTGNISIFTLGLSLTPYQTLEIPAVGNYEVSGLRAGRYLTAAFMDVNGNGNFDLDEPFDFTESLVEIAAGELNVTVNLNLKVEDISTVETVDRHFAPDKFALGDNYPNPFNPTTQFQYHLAEQRPVTITVYNLLGHEIRTLVNHSQPAGTHTISWDGKDKTGHDVASGIYLYRLKAGDFISFKRMTLIR